MLHTFRLKALSAVLMAFLLPAAVAAQEICNNGIDDDGDGLIDLNDPECVCSTLVAPPDLASYIRNHSFEERGCCPLNFVSFLSPPWLDCATGWHQATASTSDYFHNCGYYPGGVPWPPPDGDGVVGFFAYEDYKEYVGTCLTYPAPANPLLAGTTYTLSLWIAGAAVNGMLSQTMEQSRAISTLFTEQMPLAIFGYSNACVPFPVDVPPGGNDCIGEVPGWNELGRVLVQPSGDWVRVSITFTPTDEIHSIMIGGACDVSSAFVDRPFTDSQGVTGSYGPYFVVDELMLTIAQDQVLSPTTSTGNLCSGDVVVTAQPPAGATNYQWYLDGVALVGQTSTTLNVSAGGYGAGLYTMAMDYNGECLMGSAPVAPAASPTPLPLLAPNAGCAPLTVAFADTTGGGTEIVQWDLGDGTTSTDSSLTHTYTQAGSYDVTLRVRNSTGCIGETVLPGAVVVYPGLNGQISATPDPVFAEDPTVQLDGSGSGNIISWWWDLGVADPATSDDQSLQATFPAEPGTYPVMLVVSSADGCIDTLRTVITVIDPGVIELPNVFSPNGDGLNDQFIPVDYKGAKGQMEIYNRWGQLIFSTRALGQGWSGRDATEGTYFYVVTPDEPSAPTRTGHITLVR